MTAGPDDPTPVDLDVDLVRRFLSNRDADVEKLTLLQSATARLSEEVRALTEAVTTYATQGQIQDIEKTLADHETQFETRTKALVALRLRIRRRTNVMFAITCVLLILTSALLWYYVANYQHDRQAACEERNHQLIVQNQQSRAYFVPKLAEEKANPHADPVLTSILETLASSKPTLIKCD